MPYGFQNNYFLTKALPSGIGYPFTLAAWMNWRSNSTSFPVVISLSDVSTTNNYVHIYVDSNFMPSAEVKSPAADQTLTTSTALTVGQWYHLCFVGAAWNDVRIYVNGILKNSNPSFSNPGPTGMDHLGIGYLWTSSNAYSGQGEGQCYSAWWNAGLTAPEVAQLALGFSPRQTRPASLISFNDLLGTHPNIIRDRCSTSAFTLSGSTPPFTYSPPRLRR